MVTDGELVEELCEIEDVLTEWEVEFVDSISKWLKEHGGLTEGQRKKAEEILDEKG